MDTVTPSLWFDGNAEQAAKFYVGLFPDRRIERAMQAMLEMSRIEIDVAERAFRGE